MRFKFMDTSPTAQYDKKSVQYDKIYKYDKTSQYDRQSIFCHTKFRKLKNSKNSRNSKIKN